MHHTPPELRLSEGHLQLLLKCLAHPATLSIYPTWQAGPRPDFRQPCWYMCLPVFHVKFCCMGHTFGVVMYNSYFGSCQHHREKTSRGGGAKVEFLLFRGGDYRANQITDWY